MPFHFALGALLGYGFALIIELFPFAQCQFHFDPAILKVHAQRDQRKAFEQEPIVLKPWDPMGSLA